MTKKQRNTLSLVILDGSPALKPAVIIDCDQLAPKMAHDWAQQLADDTGKNVSVYAPRRRMPAGTYSPK